jgi:hypothetical protein
MMNVGRFHRATSLRFAERALADREVPRPAPAVLSLVNYSLEERRPRQIGGAATVRRRPLIARVHSAVVGSSRIPRDCRKGACSELNSQEQLPSVSGYAWVPPARARAVPAPDAKLGSACWSRSHPWFGWRAPCPVRTS